jgi:RNA polymerase sigma-70 factor (ECF subfamily)
LSLFGPSAILRSMEAMSRAVAGSFPEAFDEASLIARLRVGEPGAFEAMVRRYGGRMLAVARRLLHNEEDASDAVQDAFLSAFKAAGQFHGQSGLATWLHRITINASLMRLRTRRRLHERPIDDLLPKFHGDGHFEEPAIPWPDVPTLLARRETRDAVRQEIDRLPETYRTVLVLRDLEGLDTEETAGLLGESTSTVKSRLHRARQALRTLLDQHLRGDVA